MVLRLAGGAVVAALVCTRTDEELKSLLIPACTYYEPRPSPVSLVTFDGSLEGCVP